MNKEDSDQTTVQIRPMEREEVDAIPVIDRMYSLSASTAIVVRKARFGQ